jgi:hypothetical protein
MLRWCCIVEDDFCKNQQNIILRCSFSSLRSSSEDSIVWYRPFMETLYGNLYKIKQLRNWGKK